jgi:MFS family permease
MSAAAEIRVDWSALWRSGDLARLCFISLGIVFHAGCENMITTLMPAMVRDLGGVEFTGWTFAIYETGSIVAGAATGRFASYWTVRTNMIVAALIFALGCLATVAAPTMPWLLVGRLISGFGGGALISLSFVAVRRYFSDAIWPQLMAVLSVVWGVAAFGGPLFGGLVDAFLTWRWAFIIFALAASVFAAATRRVLRHEPIPDPSERLKGAFPARALAFLAAGVMAIAAAGVETRLLWSTVLLVAGFSGVILFFVLDARQPSSRLFPSQPFDPRRTTGAGLIMVAALSVSTCSFGFYGPLLLAALHGFTPLSIGLIICSESIAWSVLSILVAGAPRRLEAPIMTSGALMIAGGIAGFAYAVPSGSIPAILFAPCCKAAASAFSGPSPAAGSFPQQPKMNAISQQPPFPRCSAWAMRSVPRSPA